MIKSVGIIFTGVFYMRMRNKKHLSERIDAKKHLFAESISNNGKRPLYIEIGCGKGTFICENAKLNPDIDFIGIEVVSNVIVAAMEKADEYGVENLKFMSGDASVLLSDDKEHYCDRIYLNFSDPWPKTKHHKRRLTSPGFLELYKKILKPGGEIHMKTDNKDLFEYSLNTFSDNGFTLHNITFDLHNSKFEGNIMTEYEKNFSSQGFPIYRTEAILK